MKLEDLQYHIICRTCATAHKNGNLFYSEFLSNAERVKRDHLKIYRNHNVEIKDTWKDKQNENK